MSDKSPSMMRLMIREALRSVLTEDDQEKKPEEPKKPEGPKAEEPDTAPAQQAPKEETPAELAARLGLQYAGWGKYSDASGKIVAKTVQGHLVRLEPGDPDAQPQQSSQSAVPGSGQAENPYEQPVALGSSDGRTQKVNAKDLGPIKGSPAPSPEVLAARKPGTIQPPLDKSGNAIEVNIKGKKGFVDHVDPKTKKMWVTFEDGTPGIFQDGKDVTSEPDSAPDEWTTMDGPSGIPEGMIDESEASDQAAQLGLTYIGFGRYIDQSGKVVAKSVNGRLTKIEPGEDEADPELAPELLKDLDMIFDAASDVEYQPKGLTHKNPGWNKDMEMSKKDVAFDANAEKTVKKLLAKVGDPIRLIRWLIKKFREETTNGKQRILQYLGVLKDMGIMPEVDAEGEPKKAPEAAPQEAERGSLFDL